MMWLVFLKESRELIRDRKYLMTAVLVPLLMSPLLIFGGGYVGAMLAEEELSKVLSVALNNGEKIPQLSQQLVQHEQFELTELASSIDPVQAIDEQMVDLHLDIITQADHHEIVVYYRQTDVSGDALEDLNQLVQSLNRQQVEQTILRLGIEESELQAKLDPIRMTKVNKSTEEEFFADLVTPLVALLLFLWMLTFATTIAPDLIAGEKERGTLETLLISPVHILQMVSGKWLLISVATLLAGVTEILSIWLPLQVGGQWLGEEFQPLLNALTMQTVFIGTLTAIPAAAVIGAAFTLVCSFASSFKEAQSYGSVLMIALLLPMMLSMNDIFDVSTPLLMIPFFNAQLLFSAIVDGNYSVLQVIQVFAVNAAVTMAILTATVARYRSEGILQRT